MRKWPKVFKSTPQVLLILLKTRHDSIKFHSSSSFNTFKEKSFKKTPRRNKSSLLIGDVKVEAKSVRTSAV